MSQRQAYTGTVIRSLPLHRWMSRLAVVAVLLMVLAPLVSRALQVPAMASAVSMAGHGGHAMPGMDPAAAMPGMDHGHTVAGSSHADHGEACEYCVLAMGALPWLVVLPVLPAALHPLPPAAPRKVDASLGLRWSPHLARGPPRFS